MSQTEQAVESYRTQIANLQVGETFTKSKAITTSKGTGGLLEAKAAMRNTIGTQVQRARKITGHEYETITGEMITPDGKVFALVIVIRTA